MIFGSATLDIALGMVLFYYLLSLICSAINEGLANLLKLRANTLLEGIVSLLNDTAMQREIGKFAQQSWWNKLARLFGRNRQPLLVGVTQAFYTHPLIRGLGENAALKPITESTPSIVRVARPSYISARTFTQVILDLLLNFSLDGATPPQSQPQAESIGERYKRIRTTLAALTDPQKQDDKSAPAKVLLLLIDQAGIDLTRVEHVEQLRQELAAARTAFNEHLSTPNNPLLSPALDHLKLLEDKLAKAETDLTTRWNQAQVNIENYFNEAMDRVTGWYKRRAQRVLLSLAFLLTIALNADSISMVTQLARGPELRTAATTYAQKIIADAPAAGTLPANQTTGNRAAAVTASPAITGTNAISITIGQVENALNAINAIGYEIGWAKWWASGPHSLADWVSKLTGLLITTLAVSMGAPFWFDLLNKVVNLRTAGKKPDEPKGEQANKRD